MRKGKIIRLPIAAFKHDHDQATVGPSGPPRPGTPEDFFPRGGTRFRCESEFFLNIENPFQALIC